jgi:tRNA(fMet)-specific endonuclease VapC
MYLLDTDILTHFFRGNSNINAYIREHKHEVICTSIVSKIEILQGRMNFLLKASDANQLLRAQSWLEQTELMLNQFIILPFDTESATIFERLKQLANYKKIGHADLLIASIALANQAILVTRNTKDFTKIKQLKIENWMD